MLKELPTHGIAVKFDSRLRVAIYEFGKTVNARTMSDAIRALVLMGVERASSMESSALKAGYREGVNRGIGLVKRLLMTGLNQEMSTIDATDDLTASNND